eukprot:3156530-Pyramimonas_sp.AAC.1
MEVTKPYEKLILSDLEQQPRPSEGTSDSHPEVKLFRDTLIHTCDLCNDGAKGPFFTISGLPTSSDKFTTYDKMMFNDQVLQYGLVFWGSPHWGETSEDNWNKWESSGQFKTNAMESMSWHSPRALCVMTFSEDYKVEFRSPFYNNDKNTPDIRVPRKLEICQAYFRRYHPLMSGKELHKVHGTKRVMVAMLVPD